MEGVRSGQAQIDRLLEKVEEQRKRQGEIETTIYKHSGEVKNKQDDKDVIMMLIPEIVKARQGQKNRIGELLDKIIEEDDCEAIKDMLRIAKINHF